MVTEIQPLPSDIRSKLRSCVTITSPLQAVQELVLNSVDAESTSIAVRVDLSIFRFQVVDNGSGICRRNLSFVGKRYATSKFTSISGQSNEPGPHYGYRGEALASLVDVAGYLEVTSCCNSCRNGLHGHPTDGPKLQHSMTEGEHNQNSSIDGIQFTCNGGNAIPEKGKENPTETRDRKSNILINPLSKQYGESDGKGSTDKAEFSDIHGLFDYANDVPTSGLQEFESTFVKVFSFGKGSGIKQASHQRPSAGTTVTVQDFMYCMPIRQKMIKEAVDLENIRSWLEGMVLIHPHIAFTLRNDISTGPLLLQSKKCASMMGAVQQMFGDSLADSLAEIHHSFGPVTVTGYISTQACPTKSFQYIYINKRLVLKNQIHKFMNKILSKSSVVNCKRNVYYYNKNSKSNRSPSSPPKGMKFYGIFILNITCPDHECDILLDPTRTLVEFRNWSRVWSCLEGAVLKFGQEENVSISLDDTCSPVENIKINSEMKQVQIDKNIEKLPIVIRSQEKLKIFSHKRKSARHSSTEPPVKKYGKLIEISDVSNAIQSRVVRRPKTKSANPLDENKNKSSEPDSTVIPPTSKNSVDNAVRYNKEDNKTSAIVPFKSSLEEFRKEVQRVQQPSYASNHKSIARHESTATCTNREHQKSNKRVAWALKDHQMSSSSESSDGETNNKDNATFCFDRKNNKGKIIRPDNDGTNKEYLQNNGPRSACAESGTFLCSSSIQEFCLQYNKDEKEKIIGEPSALLHTPLASPTTPTSVKVKHFSDSSSDVTGNFSQLQTRSFLEIKSNANVHSKVYPVGAPSAIGAPKTYGNKGLKMSRPIAGRRSKIVDIRVPLGQLFNKTLSSTLKDNYRKEQTRLKTSSTLESFRFKSKCSDKDREVDVKIAARQNCLERKCHSVDSAPSSTSDGGENSFYFNPVILDSKPFHISLKRMELHKNVQQNDGNPHMEDPLVSGTQSWKKSYPLVEKSPLSCMNVDLIPGCEAPGNYGNSVFQASKEKASLVSHGSCGKQPIEVVSPDGKSFGELHSGNDIRSVDNFDVYPTVVIADSKTEVVSAPQASPPKSINANQSSLPCIDDRGNDTMAGPLESDDVPGMSMLQPNTLRGFSCDSDRLKNRPVSANTGDLCNFDSGKKESMQHESTNVQLNDHCDSSSNSEALEASFSSHRCLNLHHHGDTQQSHGNDSHVYDSHPNNAPQPKLEFVNKPVTGISNTNYAIEEKLQIANLISHPPTQDILCTDTDVQITPENVSVISANGKPTHDMKTIQECETGSSSSEVNNNDCSDKHTKSNTMSGLDENAEVALHQAYLNNVETIPRTDNTTSEVLGKMPTPREKLLISADPLRVTLFMEFFEMNLGCHDAVVLASNSNFPREYIASTSSLLCHGEEHSILASDQCASNTGPKEVSDTGYGTFEFDAHSKSTTVTSDECLARADCKKDLTLDDLTVSNIPAKPNRVEETGKLQPHKASQNSCSTTVRPTLSDLLPCSNSIDCDQTSCNMSKPVLIPQDSVDCHTTGNQIGSDTPSCNQASNFYDKDTIRYHHSSDSTTTQRSDNLTSQIRGNEPSSSMNSMWLTQQTRLPDSSKNSSDVVPGTLSLSIENDPLKLLVAGPSSPKPKVSNNEGNFSHIFDEKTRLEREKSISSQQIVLHEDISVNTSTLAGKLNAKINSNNLSVDFYNHQDANASGSFASVNERENSSNTVGSLVPDSLKRPIEEWKQAKDHHGQIIYVNLRSGNSSYVQPQTIYKDVSGTSTLGWPDKELMCAPVQTIPITNEPGGVFRDGWTKFTPFCIARGFSTLGKERLSLSSKLAQKKNMTKCTDALPTLQPVVLYDDEMHGLPDTIKLAEKKVSAASVDDGCSVKTEVVDVSYTTPSLCAAIDEFNRETDAMSFNSAQSEPGSNPIDSTGYLSQPSQRDHVKSEQSHFITDTTRRDTSASKVIAEASFTHSMIGRRPVEDAAKLFSNRNILADCKETFVNPETSKKAECKETLVNPEASRNAEQIIKEICSNARVSSVAIDPDILKLTNAWTEAVGPRASKDVSGEEENAYKFTKDMLKTCRVLGQLDRKFILCTLDYPRPSSHVPGNKSSLESQKENAKGCTDCLGSQTTQSSPINAISSKQSLPDLVDSVAGVNPFSTSELEGKGKPPSTTPLLVVFDQHAVHERIRLEAILESYYTEPSNPCDSSSQTTVGPRKVLKSWPVTPNIELNFLETDIRIMEEYRSVIESFGLVFEKTSCDSSTVRFTRLPVCLFPRSVVTDALEKGATEDTCPPEEEITAQRWQGGYSEKVAANPARQSALEKPPDRSTNTAELFKDPSSQFARRWRSYRGRLVQAVVQQVCDGIRHTRTPPCSLPQPLLDTLHTQACRGAIKFGQRLSSAQCRSLLTALTRCALPFQCAHGRPSLVPLCDLTAVGARGGRTQNRGPNFKKLRAMMRQNPSP